MKEQQTHLSFRAKGKTLWECCVLTNNTITEGHRAVTGRGQCMGTPITGSKTGTLALQEKKKKNKKKGKYHTTTGSGRREEAEPARKDFNVFTYVFSSVICFPLGREQERFGT